MKVKRAGKGQIFRCGAGHHYPEALLIEGQDPPHLNGTYCLVCFGGRLIGRLAVPRAEAIADPFEPAQAEPEPAQEGNPSQVEPGDTPEQTEGVEVPPPNQPAEEEAVERAEEVPAREADPDSGEAEGEPGDAEGQGAGEEPAD